MGAVYKETFTKPLPAGAKIIVRKGQRLAQWQDAKGKTRTAPLTVGKDGQDRIVIEAGTYTAKYRDGSGIVRKVATGCRDETAARSVLGDLERRAELVKGKVLTAAEADAIDHQDAPLADHFAAYLAHLEAEGTAPEHRANVNRCLRRLAADCGFSKLADLARERLERWLIARAHDGPKGMSARTRNTYRAAAVAFCNWCLESGRLIVNPFAAVPKADENADPRRKRRALTEKELTRLLDVARRRPLLDRMTVYRGKRKGEAYANLRRETRRRLDMLGRERALIYKTLVLTGLRKGELASLTVGQLDLDADPPFLTLDPAHEKNREGNSIPLRADLAADLRQWLADRLQTLQGAANAPTVRLDPEAGRRSRGRRGDSQALPPDTPLFTVPAGLVRILDRDLKLAGIPKRDERGRTVDVHAMRTTFGTLLSKGGVTPRTAQAAMRHSKIDLTMNVYTDPRLLDVAGAVEALPSLPLGPEHGQADSERVAAKATGTDDLTPSPLVPVLVPATDKPRVLQSIRVQRSSPAITDAIAEALAASALPVNENDPLTTAVNGSLGVGVAGLEPVTSSLSSWRSNQLS